MPVLHYDPLKTVLLSDQTKQQNASVLAGLGALKMNPKLGPPSNQVTNVKLV